jgi:hypothetical protein
MAEDGSLQRAEDGVLSPAQHRRSGARVGYPSDNPMDVFLTTRLADPPIPVLKYPSVAQRWGADRRMASGCSSRTRLFRVSGQAIVEGTGGGYAERHRHVRL